MREIIYIQAGKYSNYVGTHFWNTQEAYFDYSPPRDGEPQKSDIDHDISFREGEGRDGTPTYCPRLLIFDSRDNFGALSKLNDLYAPPDDLTRDLSFGAGGVDEIRQLLIEPSEYQKNLDEEEDSSDPPLKGDQSSSVIHDRYWSDYNRVFYHPRTIQPVNWGFTEGPLSLESGRATFGALNEETSLMEEPFRSFVEECDWLQGFQVSFDTLPFGAFTLSLLENVKDEYPKKSILAIPSLSPATGKTVTDFDLSAAWAFSLVTDALVTRELASSSLTVPIAHVSTWARNLAAVSPYIEFDPSSLYHTSAVVSAHLESATLPLRHRAGSQGIHEFASKLNWRNDNPFMCLEGALPAPPSSAQVSSYNFTTSHEPGAITAQSTVIRCDDLQLADSIRKHIALRCSEADLHPSLLHLSTYSSYPLPSSYPKFFKEAADNQTATMYSDLVSRPTSTATTLQAYSSYLKEYARRGELNQECWKGLEKDDLNELVEDLTRLSDSISVEMDEKGADDSPPDDEYEVDL
ncbi:mtDNA inheritance, partitioning of the mitochondrial organelle [Tulasnella sp. 417]|nr:mtDNA inheritance, partitioning of the mitochondrial organelle [Tulasnella sp. 417]